MHVYRRWSNYGAGWCTNFFVWVLTVVLVDPLHLYSTFSDVPSETFLEALPLFALVAAGVTANHLLFVRPHVAIHTTFVRLRNPLKEYDLPRKRIQEVGENWLSYPRFIVDGKGYVGWGLERTNIELVSGSGPLREVADHLKDEGIDLPARRDAQTNSVAERWAPIAWDDYVFAVLWGGYLISSLASSVIGSSPADLY